MQNIQRKKTTAHAGNCMSCPHGKMWTAGKLVGCTLGHRASHCPIPETDKKNH